MRNNPTWDDMEDTENKLGWTGPAVSVENTFVRDIAPSLGIIVAMNPEKQNDPYAPDLLRNGSQLADLKKQETPFFMAQRLFRIDPQYAITFNWKDYDRYSRLYPDIHIFFWVNWMRLAYPPDKPTVQVEPMEGIWDVPFSEMAQRIKAGDIPLHTYGRRVNDAQGNARDSYVFDVRTLNLIKMLKPPA